MVYAEPSNYHLVVVRVRGELRELIGDSTGTASWELKSGARGGSRGPGIQEQG